MQYGNIDGKLLSLISLVDPGVGSLLPAAEVFLSKPESDLVVCGVNRVGAVADVPPDLRS